MHVAQYWDKWRADVDTVKNAKCVCVCVGGGLTNCKGRVSFRKKNVIHL